MVFMSNCCIDLKKISSPLRAMTQNGEGNVIMVISGKVLERKLKRSVHQSGGGEREKMGEGTTGWLPLASPGEGGRKERKQGEQ